MEDQLEDICKLLEEMRKADEKSRDTRTRLRAAIGALEDLLKHEGKWYKAQAEIGAFMGVSRRTVTRLIDHPKINDRTSQSEGAELKSDETAERKKTGITLVKGMVERDVESRAERRLGRRIRFQT